MRTTIVLDPDVAKAIQPLRQRRGIGVSEAVNELIRAGLRGKASRSVFRQSTQALGLRIDVRNIAEAVEILEGPAAR
jgi:hypothetical protein